MTTVKEIIEKIEEFAPTHLASDWDPIGLSIGNQKQKVKKMLVALDLDANTLKEAQEKKVDFIFTHHPAIFNPLKTLNAEDSRQNEYMELIRSDISLYSAHTNVDAAENGMNDWLAEAIGLEKPYDWMEFSYEHDFKLLTVYGNKEELHSILRRLDKTTAGEVQKYNARLYKRNMENGKQTIKLGNLNKKVELILPNYLVKKVVNKLDVLSAEKIINYYLTAIEKQGKSYGLGRIGTLEREITIENLVEKVKQVYAVPNVRVANIDLTKKVQRIALLGGSGEKYYKNALSKGADLYITGDISYHGAQDMIREGLPFIDPGHYIENIFVKKMTDLLNKWKNNEGWSVEIIPSTKQKDVFIFK